MKASAPSISILAAGTLWGFTGVFVRYFNTLGLGAMEITQIRMMSGLLIIGLYLLIFQRSALQVRWKDLWCFLGTGIGSLLLMSWTNFSAMTYTSLAVAGVLLYTAPIFVMLLSAVLFRERITGRKLLALALAFSGCALVSGIGTDARVSPMGLAFGLGAGLSYAMYSIFGRFAIRRGYSSWTITFYSFLFCAAAGCFLCDWSLVAPGAARWQWSLLLGLVTAFAPYLLYSLGLARMESSRASILASAEPVVAALTGILLFREPMTLSAAMGILLVLSAIVLLSVPKKKDR